MTRRWTRSVLVAALGWLLVLAGTVLPWTSNRAGRSTWLVEVAERHPLLITQYVGALVVLGIGLAMLVLGAPTSTVLLPAVAGALTLLGVVLATPRPEAITIGADAFGRTFETYDQTTWSAGPASVVLGGLLMVAVAVSYARTRRRPE